ncbi:alpha/beta hydrolase [Paenibacillus oenotherae]|uniref:Alpha/beta hydrolase n=2 Tax=Paenibacillus oenotherae TaxID=1435645 RepID=A0ABS7D676_9BACL|nr:alpha/beta hydrolase [Paenibacillus oenotherae]
MSEAELLEQSFELDLGSELVVRGEVRVRDDGIAKPALIVSHGFKGFKDWGFIPYAARSMAAGGYAVITFNFSCSGVRETDFDELDKFGVNTYSREQADLEALLAALVEGRLPLVHLIERSSIFLLGHSRGGGNSVLFAAEHPLIRAVVAWNGIGDCNLFDEAFREEVLRNGVGYVANARTKQQMPIARVFFDDLDSNSERFNIPARAAEIDTPILFIQGDGDSERLLEGNRLLREAAPDKSHVTLEGANHTFGAVHPFAGTTGHLEKAIELSLAFLNKYTGN